MTFCLGSDRIPYGWRRTCWRGRNGGGDDGYNGPLDFDVLELEERWREGR
jgi:hypothetical protein